MLTIHQIINSPIPSNCFVISDKTFGNDCVIVDPGSKSDKKLFAFLNEEQLKPQYIILTHEHFDHCWGVNKLVEKYQTPIICSELCAECIQFEKRNCSVFYDNNERFTITSKAISIESLNSVLPFAGTDFCFFSSPGHTDASICFTIDKNLFTGDTLIQGLRTVTKLPTGSSFKLKQTLEDIAQMQGKEYTVYPGHGDIFRLDGYIIKQ